LVLDAHVLPFQSRSLRAIVMTDVLHHLPQVHRFFIEAGRCVQPGGVMAMIEPWVASWSRFVYTRFHHEPFRPDAQTWEFPTTGPVSGANGALPWLIFHRDRGIFESELSMWEVEAIEPIMPFWCRAESRFGASCRGGHSAGGVWTLGSIGGRCSR
jgi:ubiquinone/menaquinone biosynthesis C-methylase UbiE